MDTLEWVIFKLLRGFAVKGVKYTADAPETPKQETTFGFSFVRNLFSS